MVVAKNDECMLPGDGLNKAKKKPQCIGTEPKLETFFSFLVWQKGMYAEHHRVVLLKKDQK